MKTERDTIESLSRELSLSRAREVGLREALMEFIRIARESQDWTIQELDRPLSRAMTRGEQALSSPASEVETDSGHLADSQH